MYNEELDSIDDLIDGFSLKIWKFIVKKPDPNSVLGQKMYFFITQKIDFLYLEKTMVILSGSVADPGCLSRIRIFPSRIPDPGTRIPDPGPQIKKIPDPLSA